MDLKSLFLSIGDGIIGGLNLVAAGGDPPAEVAPGFLGSGAWMQYAMIIGLVVIFWLIVMRPQKKREKETQRMRDNIEIGDEVITNAGIIGIIVSIKDDTVVIETGSDRSKIRIKKWAIQSNETIKDS